MHLCYLMCKLIFDFLGLKSLHFHSIDLYTCHCLPEVRDVLNVRSSTMVKVRGKNIRIKIPSCRALKKLNNTDGI